MDLSQDINLEIDIVEDESILKKFENANTAAILTTKYETSGSSSPHQKESCNESFDAQGERP